MPAEPDTDRRHVTLGLSLTTQELEMLTVIATTGGFQTLEAAMLSGAWRLGRHLGIDVPPKLFDQAAGVHRAAKSDR